MSAYGLTEFTADPQFLQQQGGNGKLFRTKLRLITALQSRPMTTPLTVKTPAMTICR